MIPRTPFIKLAALKSWLTGRGFTESQVAKWVRDEVIPHQTFQGSAHRYYPVAKVAAALGIDDPLSSSPTK